MYIYLTSVSFAVQYASSFDLIRDIEMFPFVS